jgi:methionyl-tRNA formyltransferase
VKEQVAALGADLFVLAGYNRILPPELVNLPRRGVINLHAGRLPQYRGCAPIPWQIIRGEQELGLSVLYADEGIDTGAILARETFYLGPEEGATEAEARAVAIFPEMLVRVLRGLEDGTLHPVPQDSSQAVYYTRRYPRDGLIDCRLQTAEEVHNLIRALRPPYPGAFAWCGKRKVVLHASRLLNEEIRGIPGHIPLRWAEGMILIARDRGLLVTQLREGEQIVPAGERLRVGDRLLPWPEEGEGQ